MAKRGVLDKLIQIAVPPPIYDKIRIAAERKYGGNMSYTVRMAIYRYLVGEGLLTEVELVAALTPEVNLIAADAMGTTT